MLKQWIVYLKKILKVIDQKKKNKIRFTIIIITFFFVLNFICYWIGLYIVFNELLYTKKAIEYKYMSIPVASMGALFDYASLWITIKLARIAVKSKRNRVYILVISIDIITAILATFWILFAFISAGWIINLVLDNPETFNQRTELYEKRLDKLISDPFHPYSLKNLYFGILIGASAFLPTIIHLTLALISITSWLTVKLKATTNSGSKVHNR